MYSKDEYKLLRMGEAIHNVVVAEGGFMAHSQDGSRFLKLNRETGEFGMFFSKELLALMSKNIDAIKFYAAHRRRQLDRSIHRKCDRGDHENYPPG